MSYSIVLAVMICVLYPNAAIAGGTPDDVVMTHWRPYELWSSPNVFKLLLQAAHDGAQAIMSSTDGHLMRVISNVMVRVDVVLGATWDSSGQISLWPMVNEMDWFNSAGMLTSFWKDSTVSDDPTSSTGGEAEDAVTSLQASKGFKVAEGLYNEILHTHMG